jgi:CRISPR/Cas system-associated exonuclease Cas4 (RecB family)
MIFSYTQLSQYLTCPRRYEYRYIEGLRPPENSASLLFGRSFETALAALFRKEDAAAALFEAWEEHRTGELSYPKGETWDQMFHRGVMLLERLTQDDKITIADPEADLQVPLHKSLGSHEVQGFADAIGSFKGERALIDWKTTSARYADELPELIRLDPQLICYSWLSGISRVGFVVFVRKRLPEIQYLFAEITDAQRKDFEELALATIESIERGCFPRHCGIRFPNNPCTSCPYLGICLDQPAAHANLIRVEGNSLDWVHELDF